MNERPDSALLLAEGRWLSALARRLVRDGIEAEELAQDTLAHSLEHRPDSSLPLRGWLATVLRRRLGDRRRRARARAVREQLAAREEAQPSTLDVVAKAEQQRLLVETLLRLDEPYRTTVLLRFFEDLPPRAIAARLRVPVGTVHSRLQRALAELRATLDRGQGRQRWLSALVPLTGSSPWTAPWTIGVSLMHGALKVAAAVVVAAGVYLWWTQPGAERVPQPELVTAAANANAAEPSEVPIRPKLASESSAARVAQPGGAGMAAPSEQPVGEPSPRALRGRVLELSGRGVAGVQLAGCAGGAPETRTALGVSGVGGAFEFVLPQQVVGVCSDDPRWSTVLAGSARTHADNETQVLVAPRLELGGRVVDEDGAALAGVELGVHLPRGLGADLGVLLDYSLARVWHARSDEQGLFALSDVPFVERGTLHASLAGYTTHVEPLPSTPLGALRLTLARQRAAEGFVRGVVLDPAGGVVAGARVSAGAGVALSDARGEFALPIGEPELLPRLMAVAAGYQAARFEPERGPDGPLWPARVVLELGPPPLAIAGRVLGPDRAPRAGVRVWLVDPACLGHEDNDVVLAESFLSGRSGVFWAYVSSDADGRFELGGLSARAYAVAALDARTLVRADATEVAAGTRDLELVLDDLVHERVRGRIVARDGAGLAGVSVKFQRPVLEVAVPGGTRDEWHDSETVQTDAEGRYELRDVPRTGVEIFTWGDAILFAGRWLTAEADVERFDVTAERRLHLQVELDPPYDRADDVRVLDEAGKPLILRVMRGESSYTSRNARLEQGRTQILSLGESAREVLLLRDGREVGRVPVRLAPGAVQRVRW